MTLEEYLQDAAVAHGHLCAGQVLGVRMAMLGLKKLGLEEPQGKDRKRIVTLARELRHTLAVYARVVRSGLRSTSALQRVIATDGVEIELGT